MELIPDTILIDIFEYLNPKTIKKVEKVCKRWQTIVTTSPRIIRKFFLRSTEYRCIKRNELPGQNYEDRQIQIDYQLDRLEAAMKNFPYRILYMYFYDAKFLPKDKYYDIAEKYMAKIERLWFCSDDCNVIYKSISPSTLNLVELVLVLTEDQMFDKFESLHFPKLKILNFSGSTTILKIIEATNLKKLSVKECDNLDENIKSFLLTSRNLKEIEFISEIPENLLKYAEYPFKLEKFSMNFSFFPEWPPNFVDFFTNFLLPFKDSLNTISIKLDYTDCKSIVAYVVQNFELQILNVTGRFDLENAEILDNIPENTTIKKLQVWFSVFKNHQRIMSEELDRSEVIEMRVARKCKAIERLHLFYIDGYCEDFINNIQGTNLRILNARIGDILMDTAATNDKLEVIITDDVNSKTELQKLVNFAAKFPNIRKISIESFENVFAPEYFEILFDSCPKIEEFEVRNLNKSCDEFHDSIVVENCCLKILRLGVSSIKFLRQVKNRFEETPFETRFYSIYDVCEYNWESSMAYESDTYTEDDY